MDSLSLAEEQISKIEHLGADFKNNTIFVVLLFLKSAT